MAGLESSLMKEIKKKLELYQLAGVVIWFSRLQSFKIKHYGNFIMGCAKGTPDFITVIHNKNGTVSVIFIEAKSDTGKLRPEQIEFQKEYHSPPHIHVITARTITDVVQYIDKVGIDKLLELPDTI